MWPPGVPTPWLGWKSLSSSANEEVCALWSVLRGTKQKEGYQNDNIVPRETGNVGTWASPSPGRREGAEKQELTQVWEPENPRGGLGALPGCP